MAIYSLHHQPIGKSTQARPHTSAAHVRYITRPSAASRIEAERMPDKPGKAAAFMVEGENADRKNARVSDKLMLALPRELDAEQRAQLVRGFAEEVTQGRAPWLAAFHDQGKDAHNPHAHLVIRDRDPDSGKRVAGLSEKGSTDRLRALWETHSNRALEGAGRPERIDRRTLEAQGLRREPTVHEGPKAQQIDRRGARPESRMRRYRNRPGSHLPYRNVDYCDVDGGRSRPDYNRHVRRLETPGDYWDAVDADKRTQELDQLRQIHHRPAELVEFPLVRRGVKEPRQPVDDPRTRVGTGRSLAQPEARQQGLGFPVHPEPKATPPEAQPSVNGQSLNKHGLIYGAAPGKGNDKMAKGDDDDSPEAKWRANEAKKRNLGGKFDHLLGNSYEDKDNALQKMGLFRDKYGNDELGHELRLMPGTFGDMPKDPAKAADAPRYRKELAPTYGDYGKANDEGGRLKSTFGDGLGSKPKGEQPQPSGLSSLWNRPSSSSPSGGAGGIPQENASQLRPSSYPLESPFRAEGRQQPASGQVPDNPFSTLPKERNPLSLKSPPVGKGVSEAQPKAPAQEPDAGRHPLSLKSPALPKASPSAPPSSPQGLGREALKTPISKEPRYQKRKGLDDGM